MAEFHLSKLDSFLGVVRKYMQVRGNLSQKDLAETTEVGVSTMSRFLNQKTTELSPQLIAKIVAKLNVPLHEVIDFVDESYADKFVRLVRFYKDETTTAEIPDKTETIIAPETLSEEEENKTQTIVTPTKDTMQEKNSDKNFRDMLEKLTPRQRVFLMEFLELDMEGRDLIVDIGNDLFRYLKQKGMNF